jgi:hypothetical protein
MRRLIIVLVSVTLAIVPFTTRFLPECCEVCHRRLFQMSVVECLWHGHGERLMCQDCFIKEFPDHFLMMTVPPADACFPTGLASIAGTESQDIAVPKANGSS